MAEPISASEFRRQEDVFRYLAPENNLAELGTLETASAPSEDVSFPSDEHIPRSCHDTALIAFAQLGAMRLKASRALISLIDSTYQYVLAEAIPTSTLRHDASMDTVKDKLWLGSARIPRSRSICQHVLDLDANTTRSSGSQHELALVIGDMQQDTRAHIQWFVHCGPKARFYAGVPLISPAGFIIGVYCVYHTSPREGLSNEELLDMRDLAAVVVNHLHSVRLRVDYTRAEKMVRGLTSFIEGAKTLHSPASPDEGHENDHLRATKSDKPRLSDSSHDSPATITIPGARNEPSELGVRVSTRDQSRAETTQQRILPSGSNTLFGRAANMIKETSELDGVIIFDAVIAAMPRGGYFDQSAENNVPPKIPSHQGYAQDSDSSSGESTHRRHSISSIQFSGQADPSSPSSSPSRKPRKICEVLGFSTEHGASVGDICGSLPKSISLREATLRKLLQRYPVGRIISFNISGEGSSTEDSDSYNVLPSSGQEQIKHTDSGKHRKKTIADAIQKVAPGARSVAFVPLWDYERARWFAACLCWTSDPYRSLSETTDLAYIRAFGNSVMTELARLDALSSSRGKATFASLMSHELRSPLHGILGGIQLIQETELDAFQSNMLGAIDMCSRTLLDTVDHLLDHAKINEISRLRLNASTETKHGTTQGLTTTTISPSEQFKPLASVIDLSIAAEEVIEAVFAGQSYQTISNKIDDEEVSSPRLARTGLREYTAPNVLSGKSTRKPITIIMDIPSRDEWTFEIQPGAWRRILINIFGNSLKYTNSGYIKISLKVQKDVSTSQTLVITSVKDSGIGISNDYLLNRLYKPYSQENVFSSGTGLGLSIVRQLVDSLNGYIDLNSRVGVGTEVSVTLPLLPRNPTFNPEKTNAVDRSLAIQNLQNHRICIFEKSPSLGSAEKLQPLDEIPVTRGPSLRDTLQDWYQTDAFITSQWEPRSADLIICCEPSFELLTATHSGLGQEEKPPSIIFIAVDAIEASALRNDARILNAKSVVEVITQPCGPHKLAKAILSCFQRHSSAPNVHEMQQIKYSGDATQSATRSLSPPFQSTRVLTPESDEIPQVLIVDDSQINRGLLVRLMKKLKIPYCEAVNGLEALEIYQSSDPKLKVILMDLSMPTMDGITATREIRQYERNAKLQASKIVALTGLASESTRLEAQESGLDHFLTKPVRFEDLVALLESSLIEHR